MTKSERKEQKYQILCNKVINESLSNVKEHIPNIIKALHKKEEELDEVDLSFLKIAALAFIQKSIIERADDIESFGEEFCGTSFCGDCSSCEECERGVCLLEAS